MKIQLQSFVIGVFLTLACPGQVLAQELTDDEIAQGRANAEPSVQAGDAAFQRGDFEDAVLLYQNACNGGHSQGCSNAGSMYGQGIVVTQNYDRAYVFFQRGCEFLRDASVCLYAGEAYESGALGGGNDIHVAARFYKLGCTFGNASACNRVR